MSEPLILGLAAIVVLGMAAQWLAWRFGFPSILLLLLFGLVAGPVTGRLHPDALFGPLLLPVISLSVAVILFEGGLSLRLHELREIGTPLRSLVTVGLLASWGLGAVAARTVLGWSWDIALLLGAILVVTGPTVIGPLLRTVRPHGRTAPLVKWEGILNDPIGAVLAVVVFEAILPGRAGAGTTALTGALKATAVGGAAGLAGAAVTVLLLRFHRLPDYLQNPFTLMMVVAVYAASDHVVEESGLLAVTLMGIAMANQKRVVVKNIIAFKEDLSILLLSFLFILLAARIEPASLKLLGWRSGLFLIVLLVVVRPASVLVATPRQGFTWQEKAFLSWMAPRGVVAAAVSSVFALRLAALNRSEAHALVPVVFLVIVGTVTVYGLTAYPLARWLGISGGKDEGCLLVGAHAWARAMAAGLRDAGIEVLLVDTNRGNLAAARLDGLRTRHANILAEDLPSELPLDGIGRLLALTANDEVNSLAALHFAEVFESQDVFQLSLDENKAGPGEERAVSQHLRGRLLFGREATFEFLSRRFGEGAVVKRTHLTDTFTYDDFRAHYGDGTLLLFTVGESALRVAAAGEKLAPRPGQTVIALVDEPGGASGGGAGRP